ncbi:MAG: hypothetical protein RLY20_1183 [Verrucomicrobiota bacterium]
MKKAVQTILAGAALFAAAAAGAANVTVSDSLVSLATNSWKYYTFTDSASGQSATIALAITPFSTDPLATLTALDSDTRSAVGNTNVGGDGNLIAYGEGVTFNASLVSASAGVVASSVQFNIAGLGLRAVEGAPNLYWSSSATASNSIALNGETIVALDAVGFGLNGTNYSARLDWRLNEATAYQLSDAGGIAGSGLVLSASFTVANNTDPRTNSWFTANSAKYARIYTSDANKIAGTSVTTWSNGTQTQSSPAYAGVQEVYSSANWVYVRSTGLGSHVMGPWYGNAAHTTSFPNYPVNQKFLWRIPRTPTIPGTKTQTGLGTIGFFVDGISMFDSSDGFVWTGSTEAGNGTGYWHREAYANEGATFDPGYAHQENTGNHHYHANPIALRYLLGDHVDYNVSTKTYTEGTNAPTKHSPILAWVKDGLPVYGPYGYSNPTNASSGVRRMIGGFVIRNGQSGTDNLTNTARATIPAWAQRLYNVGANQAGPAIDTTYFLGRYMEDYAYLGDLTNSFTGSNYILGVDFDLNEYNVRWCVTPEFPNGTYAYFVCTETNGTPKYPNNIGRAYFANPTGSSQTNIAETVVTNFIGGPSVREFLNPPAVNGGTVVLTWSAVEGGTYRVESTANLTSWTTNAAGIAPAANTGSYTNSSPDDARFFRVNRAALATYDAVTGTVTSGGGGGTQGISSIVPNTAPKNSTNVCTITLNSAYVPAPPPNNVAPTAVTLTRAGSPTITATGVSRNAGSGVVTATFGITGTATNAPYTVNCTFGPNTWSLTNGFTITP